MLDKGRASMASAYKSRLLSEAPKRNIIIGLPKKHLRVLKKVSCPCVPDGVGIRKCWFCGAGKTGVPGE